jgi:hypothetical protein
MEDGEREGGRRKVHSRIKAGERLLRTYMHIQLRRGISGNSARNLNRAAAAAATVFARNRGNAASASSGSECKPL